MIAPRLLAGVAALAASGSVLLAPTAASAAPVTTPTAVQVTGSSGTLTFQASSTAPFVRFSVDGHPLPAVPVDGSQLASLAWPSWGYANASHTITAADCAAPDDCGTDSDTVPFALDNAAPTLASPTSADTVRGGFTVSGTVAGGTVQIRLDSHDLTSLAGADFTYDYRGTALGQGSHTIELRSCSTDGALCDGPSVTSTFAADVLHPSVTALAPSRFSPNHDGVKDTAVVTYQLDQSSQDVTVAVLRGSTAVRTKHLGAQAGGNHTWTWNGTWDDGRRAADGTYHLQVLTTRTLNGVAVPGRGARDVTVDTTAPGLSSVTGGGATFYPVRDGFRDSFVPSVVVGESGRLQLTILNGRKVVRTLTASVTPGRRSLSWNGRRADRSLVPAGSYSFRFQATDGVGNVRRSSTFSVTLSAKRLVQRSATLYRNGDSAPNIYTDNTGCTEYSHSLSQYAHGVWLSNVCDPDYEDGLIFADWRLGLPAAARYDSISASAYGFTLQPPVLIFGAYGGGRALVVRTATGGGREQWYGLGHTTGAVVSGHSLEIGVGLADAANAGGNISDFDIKQIRVTVKYSVLQ